MSKKTPNSLLPALRQHQHNDCSGLIPAFDYDETIKVVERLESGVAELMETARLALSKRPISCDGAVLMRESSYNRLIVALNKVNKLLEN